MAWSASGLKPVWRGELVGRRRRVPWLPPNVVDTGLGLRRSCAAVVGVAVATVVVVASAWA
jgi:hypothetical protein